MADPIEYHSDNAEQYAQDYPLEEKDEAFLDLLDRFIDLVGDGRVLDAGCGPGEETDYFVRNGLDAIGVDAAEGMIEHARETNKGTYHRMDLRDLGLEDDSIDGVWCNVTMQFFPPPEMETVLDEFCRILTDDGILYITFKMGDGSITTEDYGQDITRYLITEERARTMLTDRGFEIIGSDRTELKWGLEVLNVFARMS